jgi:hypothetical protein
MRTIAIFLCTLSLSVAEAAQWHVDASAGPGGDGTATAPFSKLASVLKVLAIGDTVLVYNGTYNETVSFSKLKAGTGRTTIQAAAGHQPVIDGGGSTSYVLEANETHEMTFQDLTLQNTTGSAILFYMAHDGEVIDCTIKNATQSVELYFADRGLVSGSDLQGGVVGKASDGTVVKGCKIHHSQYQGLMLHADSKNGKYLNNEVHDNGEVNIYLDSCSDMLVDGNLVYMSGAPPAGQIGIQLADGAYPNVTAPVLANITITNNVVHNNTYGIVFWEGDFPGQSAMNNVTIANNTVVNNAQVALVWDDGPHSGTVVRNNIFADEHGTAALLLEAKSAAGVITGVTLDHNLWHMPSVLDPIDWAGKRYTYYSWNKDTGQGAGDVTGDPLFAGGWKLPVVNLKLGLGSPAIDKGATITAVTADYEGTARPVGLAYDIGAFEHTPPPPDAGPPPDSGPPPDATPVPDTTPPADAPAVDAGTGGGDDGCSCGVLGGNQPRGDGSRLLLLLVLGLGWWWVRGRRGGARPT